MNEEIVEVDSVEEAMSWLTSLKMTADIMAVLRDDSDFGISEDKWYHWGEWPQSMQGLLKKRPNQNGKLTFYYGVKREDDPVIAAFDDVRINRLGMRIDQAYAAGKAYAVDAYGNFGMITVSYFGHSKDDSQLARMLEPGFGNEWKWFDLQNWDKAVEEIKAERQKYQSITEMYRKSLDKFEKSKVLIHEMLQYK